LRRFSAAAGWLTGSLPLGDEMTPAISAASTGSSSSAHGRRLVPQPSWAGSPPKYVRAADSMP
jgi:hypothetical protein